MSFWRKVGFAGSILAATMYVAGQANAAECDGSKTIFEDDFGDDSGGWTIAPQNTRIDDSSMIVNAPQEKVLKVMNVTHSAKSADICVDVTFHNTPKLAGAGLMFWMIGLNDYYSLQIFANGSVGIFRYKNEWLALRPMSEDSSVRRGQNATNSLRVKANGSVVSVFVNGSEIREIRGEPPAPDWHFGVYSYGSKDQSNTSIFKHFRVTTIREEATQ
jgi:hypothetical protein